MAHHGLAGHGQLAVAALLGGHVHDHAAGLHALHHLGGDQPGRRLAGDQRGGDDDVCVLGLGGVHLALRGLEALAHDLGVAAAARALFFVIDLDELAAQRLDLVGHLGARVVGAHDGAQIGRRADGRQARHAGAGNEHLGRRHLARGRDLAIEIAAKGICRLDHGAVAGHTRGGGERIHLLRARERARQAVDGQHRGLARRQLLHQLGVLRRPDEVDQRTAAPHQPHFVLAGRAHLEHDVGRGPQLRGPSDDFGTGGAVGVIAEIGRISRTGFNGHRETEFDQFFHHIGHGGDAFLAREGFPGHANALWLRLGRGFSLHGRSP